MARNNQGSCFSNGMNARTFASPPLYPLLSPVKLCTHPLAGGCPKTQAPGPAPPAIAPDAAAAATQPAQSHVAQGAATAGGRGVAQAGSSNAGAVRSAQSARRVHFSLPAASGGSSAQGLAASGGELRRWEWGEYPHALTTGPPSHLRAPFTQPKIRQNPSCLPAPARELEVEVLGVAHCVSHDWHASQSLHTAHPHTLCTAALHTHPRRWRWRWAGSSSG